MQIFLAYENVFRSYFMPVQIQFILFTAITQKCHPSLFLIYVILILTRGQDIVNNYTSSQRKQHKTA